MLNTNDEIERIINWQEVIKDLTPELEKKYIAEYGKQHEELIKHRIRNMILIPESTPNITYDFFKHYKGDCIPYNIEIEALDYKKVEEELLEKLLQNMYVVICETLKIDPHKYKDEIMEIVRLPFFCCSSDFQSIYSDEIIKVEIKGLDILKETYLTKLINLGIKPLIDPQ